MLIILHFMRLSAIPRALFIVLLLSIAPLGLISCTKEQPVEHVDLPPTPVLTLSSEWGVIRSPFLRLREEPLQKAAITAHLRRGSILEIISRTEAKEAIDGSTAYWYQVNYGGLRGWVFGAFLEILDSKAEAERFARDLE
jgi:hypothetical protein